MKTIVLNVLDSEASGSFGTYHVLNAEQGIKVLPECSETIAKAKLTCDYEDAKAEAYALNRAKTSGIAPKCFGVRIVQDKASGLYYSGIVMQDLGQTTLYDRMCNGIVDDRRAYEIKERLRKELLKFGIEHDDLHEENIMFYKGKYYAIDFGPNCTTTFKVRTPVKKIGTNKSRVRSKSNRLQAA